MQPQTEGMRGEFVDFEARPASRYDHDEHASGGAFRSRSSSPHSSQGRPHADDRVPGSSTRLFITGLPKQTTTGDLTKYFSWFGELWDVLAVQDRVTGVCKGFGFVEFKEPEAAARALERPAEIHRTRVTTRPALPRRVPAPERGNTPRARTCPVCSSCGKAGHFTRHCQLANIAEKELVHNTSRLSLSGIAPGTTTGQLCGHFSNFGQVVDVGLTSAGVGFVQFATVAEASRAKAEGTALINSAQVKTSWDNNSGGRASYHGRGEPGHLSRECPNQNRSSGLVKAEEGEGNDGTESAQLKVFGLSDNITSAHLRNHFLQFGSVVTAKVARDKVTGQSKGYGYVTFAQPSTARRALQRTSVLDNVPVRVVSVFATDWRDQSCFSCGKVGHFARDCPSFPLSRGPSSPRPPSPPPHRQALLRASSPPTRPGQPSPSASASSRRHAQGPGQRREESVGDRWASVAAGRGEQSDSSWASLLRGPGRIGKVEERGANSLKQEEEEEPEQARSARPSIPAAKANDEAPPMRDAPPRSPPVASPWDSIRGEGERAAPLRLVRAGGVHESDSEGEGGSAHFPPVAKNTAGGRARGEAKAPTSRSTPRAARSESPDSHHSPVREASPRAKKGALSAGSKAGKAAGRSKGTAKASKARREAGMDDDLEKRASESSKVDKKKNKRKKKKDSEAREDEGKARHDEDDELELELELEDEDDNKATRRSAKRKRPTTGKGEAIKGSKRSKGDSSGGKAPRTTKGKARGSSKRTSHRASSPHHRSGWDDDEGGSNSNSGSGSDELESDDGNRESDSDFEEQSRQRSRKRSRQQEGRGKSNNKGAKASLPKGQPKRKARRLPASSSSSSAATSPSPPPSPQTKRLPHASDRIQCTNPVCMVVSARRDFDHNAFCSTCRGMDDALKMRILTELVLREPDLAEDVVNQTLNVYEEDSSGEDEGEGEGEGDNDDNDEERKKSARDSGPKKKKKKSKDNSSSNNNNKEGQPKPKPTFFPCEDCGRMCRNKRGLTVHRSKCHRVRVAAEPAGVEMEYVVDKVLAHRCHDGHSEYLISWQGWDETWNSWEPVENLENCRHKIAEFEASY